MTDQGRAGEVVTDWTTLRAGTDAALVLVCDASPLGRRPDRPDVPGVRLCWWGTDATRLVRASPVTRAEVSTPTNSSQVDMRAADVTTEQGASSAREDGMEMQESARLELASTGQLLSELVTRFYMADGIMADYAHAQIRGLRMMIEHYEPSLVAR